MVLYHSSYIVQASHSFNSANIPYLYSASRLLSFASGFQATCMNNLHTNKMIVLYIKQQS